MRLFTISILFVFSFLLCNCSSEPAKKPADTANPALVKEINTLDSLNEELTENTKELENRIEAVEAAIDDLSNFE